MKNDTSPVLDELAEMGTHDTLCEFFSRFSYGKYKMTKGEELVVNIREKGCTSQRRI